MALLSQTGLHCPKRRLRGAAFDCSCKRKKPKRESDFCRVPLGFVAVMESASQRREQLSGYGIP